MNDFIQAIKKSPKVTINMDSSGVWSVKAGNKLFAKDVAENSWEGKYGAKPSRDASSYLDFIQATKKDPYKSHNYSNISA
jgi:hypothetical protein